jgi:hypothetical protein
MTLLAKVVIGGACVALTAVMLLATAVGAGAGFAEAAVREFKKNNQK